MNACDSFCRFELIGCIVFICAAIICVLPEANAKSTPPKWISHKDKMGFTLKHPPGWSVTKTKFDAIVIQNPKNNAFAVILPFSMDGPGSAQNAINTLPGILLAPQLPNAEINRVKQLTENPDMAIAEASFTSNGKPYRSIMMCLILGKTGTLYGIAAPKAMFEKAKATLVHIVSSFVFTQPEATVTKNKPASSLEFVNWNEPRENAFSSKVPKGWSITGGIVRQAPTDARVSFSATSPAKDMAIFIGSGDFPTFSLPTQITATLGLQEGAQLNGMIIMRYLNGMQAAQYVVMSRLPLAGFTDLRITDIKDHPDVAEAENIKYRQQGFQGWTQSCGSVTFTGMQNGMNIRGYCFAGTLFLGTIWNINYMFGYVAKEGNEQIAEAAMFQGLAGIKWNTQWQAANQGAMAARIQSNASLNNSNSDVSDMLYESYKRRNQADDETARRRSNATLGQTDVRSDTGETWKAEAGYNYYWRVDGTNDIIGTRSPDRPANNIDLTPLEEY